MSRNNFKFILFFCCFLFTLSCRNTTQAVSLVAAPEQGIDVSEWNDDIDWHKVKSSGKTFAIIRCGYGREDREKQTDKKFYRFVRGAKNAGLKIGAYHFSYADSKSDALKEAELCLSIIGKVRLDLPLVFDIESVRQNEGLSRREMTDICKTFCERVRRERFFPMIYTGYNFIRDRLIKDELFPQYPLWLAQWGVDQPRMKCEMWQKTSDGSVPGINGRVDLNELYVDYTPFIKRFRFNNN